MAVLTRRQEAGLSTRRRDSLQTALSSETIAGFFPCSARERGTHSRQRDYLFSHRKGHVFSRGQAQARAMFAGLSLAFSQRPALSDNLPAVVTWSENVSSTVLYKHPSWLAKLSGLFIDQSQGMNAWSSMGSQAYRLWSKGVGCRALLSHS